MGTDFVDARLINLSRRCAGTHSKKEIKNNSSARIVPERTILFIIDGLAGRTGKDAACKYREFKITRLLL